MHSAILFLRELDPNPQATYNIETFTDGQGGVARPKGDTLCRRYANRSLEQIECLVPELHGLNDAGAGVFVAVNECKGQRSKDSVHRIRGVHADIDDASTETLDAIRMRLQPTIEVQTSGPGNWQFYWLLEAGENMPPALATVINRGLVCLGADKAATDVSRLLRLPGFRHMKYAGRAA